jgi:hypothetical protein
MIRAGALVLLLLTAAQTSAHQQKEAITRVLFNPRTGNIEIMHRFLLHDAEHAVKKLRNGDADVLGSPTDRAYFSKYVHSHFAIADQDGRGLPLDPVGFEIEGRFLWVYAETQIPENVESLTVSHSALLDLWPEQVNLVNVERDGVVRSATFTQGSWELTIELAN